VPALVLKSGAEVSALPGSACGVSIQISSHLPWTATLVQQDVRLIETSQYVIWVGLRRRIPGGLKKYGKQTEAGW